MIILTLTSSTKIFLMKHFVVKCFSDDSHPRTTTPASNLIDVADDEEEKMKSGSHKKKVMIDAHSW